MQPRPEINATVGVKLADAVPVSSERITASNYAERHVVIMPISDRQHGKDQAFFVTINPPERFTADNVVVVARTPGKL